jgi:protoporphyrinogen oxidase
MDERELIIIGAGPAGLSAAYEAMRHGVRPLVLEKDAIVGGIARTEQYKGYHFDMGGHRFFTKSPEVDALWREVLTDDFLRRDRLSRIFYNKKFFNYPLKPANALIGLGPIESVAVLISYVRWKLFPYREEETFEQWVTNRFGRRLYRTFFKTYTEKVWGIPCTELKAEWAAQRIKDLSLRTAVLQMFFQPTKTIKTLISAFDYPRQGPGMLWNAVKRSVEARGGEVRKGCDVTAIHRRGMTIEGVTVGVNGSARKLAAQRFITSMPVTEFIAKLDPPAPRHVLEAAKQLKYRDFLTVCVIVDKPELFPDNWIYIHEPSVQVGRIQNFKNWSPAMVPDPSKTSLGLEYFCNEGDALWSMSDQDLLALARRELESIGLARAADVIDGCVFRVPKSYPVYDSGYAGHLAVLRDFIDGLSNCKTIGRNGLHRYNNQDHSMLTGLYAVRSLLHGEKHDLWKVNAEQEYHEEVKSPEAAEQLIDEGLALIFARLDKLAAGLTLGAIGGITLFLLTLLLVAKGGPVVGPNLSLLKQYFPGYTVTPRGSWVGLFWGFASGFIFGWFFAALRNGVSFIYWTLFLQRAERSALTRLLDFI